MSGQSICQSSYNDLPLNRALFYVRNLVGRTVALLANLAPRKLRGVMSQGMILAAGDGAEIQLVTVPGDPKPGTRIS